MGYGSVTVGSGSSILIVSANDNRKALKIANLSATSIVYIGPDSSITTATALPLYEFQKTEDSWNCPGFWKGDIYGIASVSTADVRYWEII